MTSAPVKAIGLGSPILDLLVQVDDSVVSGAAGGGKGGMRLVDSVEIDDILKSCPIPSIAPGGSTANTIAAMAHLGHPAKLLGMLGKDDDGRKYRDFYAASGADVAGLKLCDSKPTARCLSLITSDAQRTMRTCLGAAASITPADLTAGDFDGCGLLHVEGYMLFNWPVAIRALELAKEAGITVSLDLSSFEVVKIFKDKLPELLERHVDILFANEDESAEYAGSKEPEEFIRLVGDKCRIVAVKLGANGAIVADGASRHRAAAKKTTAVDTTGAGDYWQAGFLFGHLNGLPIERSSEFASILGAEAVSVVGASLHNSTWERIRKTVRV